MSFEGTQFSLKHQASCCCCHRWWSKGVETYSLSWSPTFLFHTFGITPVLVLSSLMFVPIKATLHWARPFQITSVILVIGNALLDFAAFGSIFMCYRVIGYLLKWRLNEDPIKGHPYNGADAIFHNKVSPKSRTVC